MSKGNSSQSALFIGSGDGDDDATLLVVGGWGGNSKEVELLTNRSHQRRGGQASRGSAWRWRQLSPMQESRYERPGILLLRRERVLVVGGGNNTAEIFQLPRDDNDKGVWTLLTQNLTHSFMANFLVNFNNRIVVVGELLIKVLPITSKHRLSNMCCLHLRHE